MADMPLLKYQIWYMSN